MNNVMLFWEAASFIFTVVYRNAAKNSDIFTIDTDAIDPTEMFHVEGIKLVRAQAC